MRNRWIVILIGLVIFASAWSWRRRVRIDAAVSGLAIADPKVEVAVAVAGSSAAAVETSAPPPSAVAVAGPTSPSLRQMAPSLGQIRKAVEANPHDTPALLSGFAVTIERKMEVARTSEDKARSVFAELEECALGGDSNGNTSVQALCIVNAKRLRTQYPSFARRYDVLEKQSDPKAVRLMNALPE